MALGKGRGPSSSKKSSSEPGAIGHHGQPSWRSSVLLRIILLALGMSVGAALLYYISEQFDSFIGLFLRLMAGVLVSVAATTLAAWVLKDSIRDYIAEVLRAGVSEKRFLARLSQNSLEGVIRSCLDLWSPWCASALADAVVSARKYRHAESKQNTHYSWSIADCRTDALIETSDGPLALSKDDYFECSIYDEVQYEVDALNKDMLAVFILQEDVNSSIDLAKNFSEGSVFYRDFFYLSSSATAILSTLLKTSVGIIDLKQNPNPFANLVDFHLKVQGVTRDGVRDIHPMIIKPTEIQVDERYIAFRFPAVSFSSAKISNNIERLLVSMVVRTKLHRRTGSYPIIFSTFTHDPEIRVRINSTAITSHNWVGFMEMGAVEFDIDDDGMGYRIHTRDRATGKPHWVLPGDGITIRWQLT